MKSPADMRVIQIEITNACPKRCSNCTRFCGHHVEPFFMDFDTFKTAVDSMKGFKGVVGIMGGEPTIHPEFERFVKYFRENFGYDDFSTTPYKPSSDFMRHILGNSYNVLLSNQRGLWTSVTPRYYKHFELIQDTFGYQLLNDHTNSSMHETLMVTRKELGVPDDEWIKMRDKCWIQNLWSASITPKGAFFCEVAAAMDATLGGPGGWKIEPGWWNRKPSEFGDQLDWCEMCSACLPMPKRDANGEIDDVSPVWAAKLAEIKSPKLAHGLVNEFDPKAYDSTKHEVIDERTPYLKDQEQRMGKGRNTLLPRQIYRVAWLSADLSLKQATGFVWAARNLGLLDMVASKNPSFRMLADQVSVPFLDASEGPADKTFARLKSEGKILDWILLMRDGLPSARFFDLFKTCVFNPGCLYSWSSQSGKPSFEFVHVRASSLSAGGDIADLGRLFPRRKVVRLVSDRASDYRLSAAKMLFRRCIKLFYWLNKRIGRRLGAPALAT